MWTPVVQSGESMPSSRSKHAGCVHVSSGHVYILAGRNGNVALRDFWRFHPDTNIWERVSGQGPGPGCLQGHSMVEHQDVLYVFGGELSFCNDQETPLWMFDIKENSWRKYQAPRGVATPKGRRGHTAVVHGDCLYIYGGYQDLRGSSSELWAFHLPSETWHLVSQGQGAGQGACQVPPKHHHSAVIHNDAMWVFGGMSDLHERSDCWKFDFVTRCWHPVRSRPGPGCLHSHSAVKINNLMIIFGGERDGQTVNEVWRFHFATEAWDRVVVPTLSPQPRSQLVCFTLPGSDCEARAPDLPGLATPSLTRSARAMVQRLKGEAESILESRHGLASQRYSFLPPDSATEDSDSEAEDERFRRYRELPREIYRDLTRPSQFQRLEAASDEAKVTSNTSRERPSSIVKDLARVNISELLHPGGQAGLSSQYRVFTNQSSDSLNSVQRDPSLISFDLARPSDPDTRPPGGLPKSDSAFTWQSYSCSSRASTLSSALRDATEVTDTGLMTEDEESSGYDSFESGPSNVTHCSSVDTPGAAPMSILNPCYSGPDVDTHNSFASVLMNPTGKEKGDTKRFEGVEMRERGSGARRPRPRSEIVTSSVTGSRGPRPVSDCVMSPERDRPVTRCDMVMWVMGGREVGQINMFQRHISVWKLRI